MRTLLFSILFVAFLFCNMSFAGERKCEICGRIIQDDELEYIISISIYLTDEVMSQIHNNKNWYTAANPPASPKGRCNITVDGEHWKEGIDKCYEEASKHYNENADAFERWDRGE